MSEERSPYAATGAIRRMRERLAADTPGRRLHEALLAALLDANGWRCVEVTAGMVEDGSALGYVEQALQGTDCG